MLSDKRKPLLKYRMKGPPLKPTTHIPTPTKKVYRYPDPERWLKKKFEWDATKELLFAKQRKRIARIIQGSKKRGSIGEYSRNTTISPMSTKSNKATDQLKKKLDVTFEFHSPTKKSSTKKLYCILNYSHTKRANKDRFNRSIISPNTPSCNPDHTH